MKELNEVWVPPTLLPTEKRQYLQPKANEKRYTKSIPFNEVKRIS